MSYKLTKNKFLSATEQQQLQDTMKRCKTASPRDLLLLQVALATGARATELLAIRLVDLDDEQQTVYIHGIKGSSDREIPLPATLYKRLKDAATDGGGDPFGIGYRRLVDIWQLYRPAAKKFHSLRHTFALELYKRCKDIKLVQTALGHKSINNTMIYLDFVTDTAALRKALL